jgi:signal transduction histidine kinase/ActR/RegA family two-component response regulator
MSILRELPKPPFPVEPRSLIHEHSIELVRANELLRDEIEKLRDQSARLLNELRATQEDREADRCFRRAALNLLEDADSARRAAEKEAQERERVEHELHDADRRKDEFLATLAHELRNPLAPIRNSVNLLRLAVADSGVTEELYRILERQVGHLVRLVDDLMDVSRISRGKLDLRLAPIELAPAVRDAVETSKPLIEGAGHCLTIDLPPEPLMLFADAMRVTQILVNLLNNAAKYTCERGQIWLTVRQEGTHAVVSVKDTGLGIPPEMLPKVFEAFTQIDNTLGRRQGGLGIGLSLVRSLATAHGGSAEARSEGAGKGSEFIVRLPLATGVAIPQPPHRRIETSLSLARRRIAIVDDNRDAAETLAMTLKYLGAETVSAGDGATGLAVVERFRPGVIIVNINMPGMDGCEVARRLRQLQLSESQGLTLIALTGRGQEEDRRRVMEAGFDHYIVKPADLAKLEALLASLPS